MLLMYIGSTVVQSIVYFHVVGFIAMQVEGTERNSGTDSATVSRQWNRLSESIQSDSKVTPKCFSYL